MQRRRTRKPLTLSELKGSMSTALLELERIYLDSDVEPDLRIKAINSLSSLSNSYSRLIETAELEERISKLEQANLKAVS